MASKLDDRRAVWAQRVADQRASGLSAAAWCREHGINQPSLHYWHKQLPQAAEDATVCGPQWLAVAMDKLTGAQDRDFDIATWGAPANGLTLRIGHVSIDIAPDFDPHLLRNVLDVLARQAAQDQETR